MEIIEITGAATMSDMEARGRELFDGGLYCAEAVLKAIAERQGIESDLVPGIATGLCAGMARRGGPCGAMTGAILALGMIYGRKTAEQPVQDTFDAVQEMMDQFVERFGSSNCTELLGVDLGTPEGQQAFKDQNLGERCSLYTGVATALVDEIANSEG
jgi:C_GCAxxG_C_C family probable redox protein